MDPLNPVYQDGLFNKVPTPLFRIRRDRDRFVFADSNRSGHLLTQGGITSLYGRDVDDIWCTAENRHIAQNIHAAHASNAPIDEEFWHTFVSDGKRRYIHISYVPIGADDVMLFVYDLTDSHLRIQQALQGKAKYEALFQRSRQGLIEGTSERFMDCNDELVRLLGYPREELLQLNLARVSHPDDVSRAMQALVRLQRDPLHVDGWSGRAVRKDGSLLWCEVTVTGVLDDHGRLSHFIAAVTDISARRNAEDRARVAMGDIIKALAAAVDARDPYTSGHMVRVSEFAVLLGSALGMDDSALEGLRLGALVHDLGKIGIPIDILNKPGKLSPAELGLVHSHAQIGHDIFKDIEFPWPIRAMLLQHHERLDGSGYPASLRGGQIIREARIIAVADMLEAITSHRPYRPAFEDDVAMEMLRREKGRLEPKIVDTALRLIDEGVIRLH